MLNKRPSIALIVGALLVLPLTAMAQGKGQTSTAASKGGVVSVETVVARYSSLAGSEANAKSLVNGLRTGDDISLTGLVPTQVTRVVETKVPVPCPKPANPFLPPQTNCFTITKTTVTETVMVESTITFSPRPAAPMGFGNVDIALALTEADIGAKAISNPTPAQLQAALLGGTVGNVTFAGVLSLRTNHSGWGEVAKKLGFDLK